MNNRTSWTWRHAFSRSEIPSTTKLVLHTIGLHMNETGGGAYPTVKQISDLSSLSERAVCTHIQNAIDSGWLRSKVHGFKGQKWKNHEYEAWWPAEEGDGKASDKHSLEKTNWLNDIPLTKDASEEEKVKARKVIGNDLYNNRLSKGPCYCCGDENVEAHHPDYSQPRYVFWLCRKHHIEVHDRDKRTERRSKNALDALNVVPKRTERHDINALNVVQSNVSNNIPINSIEAQAPSKRGSRLPTDWFPSKADCDLAISLGVNPEAELDKFHDYWCSVPGQKGCKLDWAATWRNWVRNARTKSPQKITSTEKVLHLFADAAKQ